MLYLGCKKTWPQLAHHDFYFSADSDAEFRDLYEKKIPHEDPTCYLAVPSITDPAVAPPGSTALYVLVHCPYLTDAFDWKLETARYRDVIIDKLERGGLTGLRDSIEVSHTITPRDLEQMYWVNRGAIYGVVTQKGLNSAFKTSNRSDLVKGLYWGGRKRKSRPRRSDGSHVRSDCGGVRIGRLRDGRRFSRRRCAS